MTFHPDTQVEINGVEEPLDTSHLYEGVVEGTIYLLYYLGWWDMCLCIWLLLCNCQIFSWCLGSYDLCWFLILAAIKSYGLVVSFVKILWRMVAQFNKMVTICCDTFQFKKKRRLLFFSYSYDFYLLNAFNSSVIAQTFGFAIRFLKAVWEFYYFVAPHRMSHIYIFISHSTALHKQDTLSD